MRDDFIKRVGGVFLCLIGDPGSGHAGRYRHIFPVVRFCSFCSFQLGFIRSQMNKFNIQKYARCTNKINTVCGHLNTIPPCDSNGTWFRSHSATRRLFTLATCDPGVEGQSSAGRLWTSLCAPWHCDVQTGLLPQTWQHQNI